ncbi:nrg3 [Pungitius sinensis]
MESKDVYKSQVLSITSIAVAISLLGTLCVALYCGNRRRREKLQAHLKESRSLKNYTANSQNALEAKIRVPNSNLQMHEFCKRSSQSRQGGLCGSGFAHCNISTAPSSGSRGPAKHPSPDQRTRVAHWSAPRVTPPASRGKLNPIGGSKYSGHAYQHLQEMDSCERDAEAQRGCRMNAEDRRDDPRRDAILHMQTPVSMETGCGRPNPNARGPRRPGGRRPLQSPSAPFRSCSIPIIPSVQCHHDNEASCMQTCVAAAPRGEAGRDRAALPSTSCSSAAGQPRDEVALLLEEAQEQLRALALAHRKQDEGGIGGGGATGAAAAEARETVCFLNLSGGGAGAPSCNGPTQTQLLGAGLSHRDLGPSSQ